MSVKQNDVRVSIFNQDYSIRTSADSEYMETVANYVDNRMKEIQKSFPTTTSQLRIAVLAAMNITDELFFNREQKENLVNKVEVRANKIYEFIEEKITEAEK